ncbi:MAG: pyruvate, water dikinase regulatory protein [Bradymonadia bacterium]
MSHSDQINPRRIFIVSDATGDTAETVVKAALMQFDPEAAHLELFPRVRRESQIEEIVERAADEEALIVHTTVTPSHRERLHELCSEAGVDDVDLIGTLMAKLTTFLDVKPRAEPGRIHTVNDDYFRRIEAVEFAVKNDDGQHPRNLDKSDIVLVGISRTSKTPLSTYLAQRGYKVANIPIVMGIEPPEELFRIDQRKIFALSIQTEALFRIRQARLRQLGMPADTSYGMQDHIDEELQYAQSIYKGNPQWPVLDVTDRAIEEIAATLLNIKKQRETESGSED